MILKYLKELFGRCELLKGFDIKCESLSEEEKSVSVIPTGKNEVIRAYSDGDAIIGFEFDLIFRLMMNEDNTENHNLLELILLWIYSVDLYSFNEIRELYLSDFTPVSLLVTEGPYLYNDDIHSGKYKIRCRIDNLYKHDTFFI